jgi:hypothetical protein
MADPSWNHRTGLRKRAERELRRHFPMLIPSDAEFFTALDWRGRQVLIG